MSTVFVVTRYDIHQGTKNTHSVHSTEERAKAVQDALDSVTGQYADYDAFELDDADALPQKALTYGFYMELGDRLDKFEGTGYTSAEAARKAMEFARAGRKGQTWVGSIEGYVAPTTLGYLIKGSSPQVKEVV